jgi:hypothetical protein
MGVVNVIPRPALKRIVAVILNSIGPLLSSVR